MELKEIDLNASLKKYFGFSKFIGLQEGVIQNVIQGKNTFVSCLPEVANHYATSFLH